MKTMLMIIVTTLFIVGASQVSATQVMLWPLDELTKRSDVIVLGTITGTWFDFRPFEDTKMVDTANLKISQILKGDIDSNDIEIRFYGNSGKTFDNFFGLYRGHVGPDFKSGENVLVFLDHEDPTMVMGEGYYSYPNGKYIIKEQKAFSDYANHTSIDDLKITIQNSLLDEYLPNEKLNDTDVNYVDFRDAEGEIIEVGCSLGLRASENSTLGDYFLDSLKCNSFVTLILVLVLLGIMFGAIFIVWRKRK